MKNGMYKHLFLFLFLSILCSNFVLAEDWANSDFWYRIPINITNLNVTDVPNFVQIIDLDYQAEMRTDFRDVVFYEGNNSLGFTQGQKLNGIHSEFYVRIPVLNASSTHTIHAYFNNATITSQSSVEDTFYYYDNFNDGYNSSRFANFPYGLARVSDGYLIVDGGGNKLVYDSSFKPTKNTLFVMGNFCSNTTESYSYQKLWGLGENIMTGSGSSLGYLYYAGIDEQVFSKQYDGSNYSAESIAFPSDFKSNFLNYEILLYNGLPSQLSFINSSVRRNIKNYTIGAGTFAYDNYFGLSIATNDATNPMLLDYFGVGNTTFPYPTYTVGTEETNLPPVINPLDSNIIYNLFKGVGAGLGIFMNFVGYGLMILIPALVVVGIVLVLLRPIKKIFGTA